MQCNLKILILATIALCTLILSGCSINGHGFAASRSYFENASQSARMIEVNAVGIGITTETQLGIQIGRFKQQYVMPGAAGDNDNTCASNLIAEQSPATSENEQSKAINDMTMNKRDQFSYQAPWLVTRELAGLGFTIEPGRVAFNLGLAHRRKLKMPKDQQATFVDITQNGTRSLCAIYLENHP